MGISIWNDSLFLSSLNVMDYSILVGIDEENGSLVVGIIDYMRKYTWDKHLESWFKGTPGLISGKFFFFLYKKVCDLNKKIKELGKSLLSFLQNNTKIVLEMQFGSIFPWSLIRKPKSFSSRLQIKRMKN